MRHHEQTFVHAPAATVVARLPRHLDVEGVRVDLAPAWHVGPVPSSHRTVASWRRGRRHGTGTVEVRPAGWGWSELQVSWDGVGPRPAPGPIRRHHRTAGARTRTAAQELCAQVEGRAGSPPPPRAQPVRPGRVVAAIVSFALVAAAVAVWPIGTPTPVTEADAVAGFRAAADRAGDTSGDRSTDGRVTPRGDVAVPPADTSVASTPPHDPSGPTPRPTADGPQTRAGDGDAVADASPRAAPASDADAPPPAEAPDGPRTARPTAGVYRYATDGWEELDTRGGHRRFPDETVQVVHHTACGFRQVWEPVAERRDEHAFCVDPDHPALLVTTATSRSFFGQRRDQGFTCSPVRTSSEGWTARCDDAEGGTSMTVTTRREGTERREVAGQEVEVARMRVDAQLAGETSGHRRSKVWVRTSDALLVRSEVEAEIDVPGPFGPMRYREQYVLDLAVLEPRT